MQPSKTTRINEENYANMNPEVRDIYPISTQPIYDDDPLTPTIQAFRVVDRNGKALTSALPLSICLEVYDALSEYNQFRILADDDGKRGKLLCSLVMPIDPPSKKNSMQIIRGHGGRPIPIPNAKYKRAIDDVKKLGESIITYKRDGVVFPIESCIAITAHYYRRTHHRIDATNLESALSDILVSIGILADDNIRILHDTDGSRVWHDASNPRIEVSIFQYIENGKKKAP